MHHWRIIIPKSVADQLRAAVTLIVVLSAGSPASVSRATALAPIDDEQSVQISFPGVPSNFEASARGRWPRSAHPAVVRIIVPEGNATSYGSGTLVDVRDKFGLVVTNWHVVRDGKGDVEVLFPDGFRSKARPLKVDADWDLAALVIWRPQAAPVTIAAAAPQPGDQLTICGYGQGEYRARTGRCTQYYAPRADFPQQMVELDVEARQGDSGGPIFNERGELAGVLFGAGRGTTLGSFGGRVGSFLATLAPDIGRAADDALVRDKSMQAVSRQWASRSSPAVGEAANRSPAALGSDIAGSSGGPATAIDQPSARLPASFSTANDDRTHWAPVNKASHVTENTRQTESEPLRYVDYAKSGLAAIGAAAILLHLLRAVL